MGFFDFLTNKKVEVLKAELEKERRKNDVTILKQSVMDKTGINDSEIEAVALARIFEVNGSWQYEIIVGGVPVIKQDCYPGKEGFTPMTEEEATMLANGIVNGMAGATHGDN